jgi:hypothetical protein
MQVAELHKALALRHAKDVLVAECNMGSAHHSCRRLDAWALLKSWSPWTTIAYECKVNRQDFLRDRKWTDYLPVCHEFYFVCPAKLIQPEELPEGVGLLWKQAGLRLITKRKAVRHEPDAAALGRLMSYVLMSRTRIVADMWEATKPETRADYWRRWLAEKQERGALGLSVSRRLREVVADLDRERREALKERDALSETRDRLHALGLGEVRHRWQLEQKLNEFRKPAQLDEIARLAQQIERLSRPA